MSKLDRESERLLSDILHSDWRPGFAVPHPFLNKLSGNGTPMLSHWGGANCVVKDVMSAQATMGGIISRVEVDRVGDVLNPRGMDLENFRANPINFFNHIPMLPVATSLGQSVYDDRVEATSKFHQLTAISTEVCMLVMEGVLKGLSVGIIPLRLEKLPEEYRAKDEDGGSHRHGRYIARSELVEYSFVSIPAVRGALTSALESGKITSPVLKHLCAGCDESAPPWSVGMDFELPDNPKEYHTGIVEPGDSHCSDPACCDNHSTASDTIRWNKNLSPTFDVAREHLQASQLEYDWVSRYMGCQVKDVFQNATSVPSPRMGSFLSARRNVMAKFLREDLRNITYDGKEEPPIYEVIQLNSKLSDDFMVDGIEFWKSQHRRFVTKLVPTFYGLWMTVYTTVSDREFNRSLIDELWAETYANNFLKGEAFALSGEFLPKTSETWADLFLEPKNERSLQRTVSLINQKGQALPNRGLILTGPPGTGKTLGGRIIRNEANATFVWISARDFYYAGTFGGLSLGFELAKELAPTVLFIEDVDNWLNERSIDYLKTEMDGIARSSGVVTMLTTNFPERLPAALIDRPGRFHDVLKLSLPTSEVRQKMLASWLPGVDAASIEYLVRETDGMSGAHLRELVNFAGVLQEQDSLSAGQALEQALAKVREQRAMIDETQLSGSRYKPRNMSAVACEYHVQHVTDSPITHEKLTFPPGTTVYTVLEMAELGKCSLNDGEQFEFDDGVYELRKAKSGSWVAKQLSTKTAQTDQCPVEPHKLDTAGATPASATPVTKDDAETIDGTEKQEATSVQSVICSKSRFKTREEAVAWCREHDFKHDKVDETEESYRLRQFDPSECAEGSYRTIELTDGVNGVVCHRKSKDASNDNPEKDGTEKDGNGDGWQDALMELIVQRKRTAFDTNLEVALKSLHTQFSEVSNELFRLNQQNSQLREELALALGKA